MIGVKGDWNAIPENVIRTIWKTHFSEKPMPKIHVCITAPEEYLKVSRQSERLPHAHAKELMMMEYGRELKPERTGAFKFYYKREDAFYIIIRKNSKLTDEYRIKNEMEHIFESIDVQGKYVGAVGKPTHPKRPPKYAFRNRA